MWKTAFGGFTTIVFLTVLALYVCASFVSLDSGDKNWTEDTTRETNRYHDDSLSLGDMKVMPVVTLNMDTAHLYINSSSESFKRNIFVALLQDSQDEAGNKKAEFEEFAPCSEVANQTGFIPYDYLEAYSSHVIIPTIDDKLYADYRVLT